jgi:hypothetical protein
MAIQVTCPGCLSRFTVSDKYAGKKGPCPKCKKEIIVPEKGEEVVIHAPETEGPKDSKGVAVLKPIKRAELNLSRTQIGIAAGIAVLSIVLALVGRFAFSPAPAWYLAFGALALSFPIAWVGYRFLRDDELGGYLGNELSIRLAACAAIFSVTWGLYWFLSYYFGYKSLAEVEGLFFAIFLAGMILVGTLGSLACLELEFSQSLMHYVLYLGVTFLLAMVCGVELAEPLSKGDGKATPVINPGRKQPIIK